MLDLAWLPHDDDWRAKLKVLPEGDDRWAALVALARTRMDFVRTGQLDRRIGETPTGTEPVLKLALLGSSTVDQLLPSLRVAGLRRGIRVETFVADYGQYRQAALDPASDYHAFGADAVLFLIDARTLAGEAVLADEEAGAHIERRVIDMAALWRAARGGADRLVLHAAALPVFAPLLGASEHRLPGSPAALVTALNAALRPAADDAGVDIVALDDQVARSGIDGWYSPSLWHRAKQEISPAAAPLFGELVMRLIDARRGRASKCLVLDLDNTLWGGVIGDDGLDGIMLGQGSAEGEAFTAFQTYARSLAARGVILAVCSKNDEANAIEAFEQHREMVLRRDDIAAFVANWDDKATNLRRIAAELNIGIDALVFADDNPFERNIIRRELPMVAVPELPDDPSRYGEMIAAAGYFEGVAVTPEDRARNRLYQADRERRQLETETTDLAGYLASLDMRLVWGRVGGQSLKRVTQLANKTNQFNLTTRRYTEAEIDEAAAAQDGFVLHLRLTDRFADHGIIAVVIGRRAGGDTIDVESWLMSCRVLGRHVEETTLAVVAVEARRLGARRLTGTYRPSPKNNMVREHYGRLGFTLTHTSPDGATSWALDLDALPPPPDSITIEEPAHG